MRAAVRRPTRAQIMQTTSEQTYLGVGGRRRELEGRRVHEDGTVLAIEVIQEGREGLVQPAVSGDVAVAGGVGGHPQGHPALGGVADRALLTAHAVAAAAQASRADDQRQLQDQLLAAGDVNVDLEGAQAPSAHTAPPAARDSRTPAGLEVEPENGRWSRRFPASLSP